MPPVHLSRLKPVRVPQPLVEGQKFILWDEKSAGTVTSVTLHVDPKGYILYWRDQNKEAFYLDISLIHDTRTGKQARVPKEPNLRSIMGVGDNCPLEEKMVTICYGTDMVNINFLTFAALTSDMGKELTDVLFACAVNLQSTSGSPLSLLEKCHAILSLVTKVEGKTPVRSITKMFAQNKEDRKRIELTLETLDLQYSKDDCILQFTFNDFFLFYHRLCGRHEVDNVFRQLSNGKYMTAEQFKWFLNKEQRDPRLNEVLYPLCDLKKAKSIISQFEPDAEFAEAGHLSREGFLKYLLSEENAVISRDKLELSQDMSQPLSHYFINSSHNTYLTGHQLTGKSSVEIYRQVLLSGCRCVELDCWDGKGSDEEPIITHGFTVCTEVSCKDVLEAIAETAFKSSDYPVILSFENHCSTKQQAKLANYCRTIFGDMLVTDPLDSHPLESNIPLPSPELLRRKILIKNKKRNVQTNDSDVEKKFSGDIDARRPSCPLISQGISISSLPQGPLDTKPPKRPSSNVEAGSNDVSFMGEFEDFDWELDSESDPLKMLSEDALNKRRSVMQEKGTAAQEVEAGQDMSALVNYIEPIRFQSFDISESRNRSYECVSFVETQATALLKIFPVDFVNFNKRQLSRVYPKGTRVDSSNYMPQIFWNSGCQFVALNYQTLDLPMQLNLGMFEYNSRCGYILKPDFMRRRDRQFDPFTESTVDGIVAARVEIKILSGQFISDKKCGTYVEVDMFGLPADTVRRKFRTKIVPNNCINPVFDEEAFVFKKIVLPHLACLRIAVYSDKDATLLGHRVLPIDGLRPGYRHIGLRNECNQPQDSATLFVYIQVKDFVSDAFAEIAAALSNPIAYQSELERRERRAKQLSILEDMDIENRPVECGEVISPPAFNTSINSECPPRSYSLTPLHQTRIMNVAVHGGDPTLTSYGRTMSVPGSPNQSMSNLADNSKIDVSLTTRLKACVVEDARLCHLKDSKTYIKLIEKLNKQLRTLRHKNEKTQGAKLVSQQSELDKLAGRSGTMSLSRSIKQNRNDGDNSTTKRWASKFIESDEMLSTRHRHVEEFIKMCCDHYRLELDLQLCHQTSIAVQLERLADAKRDEQFQKLNKIHDREVYELKRRLDARNWEEMKEMAKKYHDKKELARVRREAMQKHIGLAVQERQKLKNLLESRQAEVMANHAQLLKQISDNRKREENCLQKFFEARCTAITSTHRATLSGGVAAVGDAQSISFESMINRSGSSSELTTDSSSSKFDESADTTSNCFSTSSESYPDSALTPSLSPSGSVSDRPFSYPGLLRNERQASSSSARNRRSETSVSDVDSTWL